MQRIDCIDLFTVVEVWRGIAASAATFTTAPKAHEHARRLRRKHNLAEDDVQIFQNSVRIGDIQPAKSLPKLRA